MSLPIVAIVGRPNVGKSSLLNCLVGKRISIVDPTPGVTRDRVSSPLPLGEGYVELVDTGGMGIEDSDNLTADVEAQIDFAIAAAALILFIVDAREGILPLDKAVAARLRRQAKNVILVANKVDTAGRAYETGELVQLGFGEPLSVSAKQAAGLADLRDEMVKRLADTLQATEAPPPPVMKLAIVGKRNAGKSTFINALAGQERVIVSEIPGTTRDSVDVAVELDGRRFVVIDTAGIQKIKSLPGDIGYYGHHRAMRSIRRADVVALMIDASVKISQVDKDLAGDITKLFKPVVLVVNKWDLAQTKAQGEDYAEYLAKIFPALSYAPISLTAAKEGLNVKATVELAEEIFDQAHTRVPTAALNTAVAEVLQLRGPSHKTGTRRPKILYCAQITVAPPTIVCFVNDVRSFDDSYQRFLLNQLRLRLPYSEVPIRLLFRQRTGRNPFVPEKPED
ncbi:MAG: ribosome biogenesis GTPase Der [Phycisphaerae bacterium]|jgi:GTP-binding protein